MEGLLNSVSAGILMYMALVDLLTEDLVDPKGEGQLEAPGRYHRLHAPRRRLDVDPRQMGLASLRRFRLSMCMRAI